MGSPEKDQDISKNLSQSQPTPTRISGDTWINITTLISVVMAAVWITQKVNSIENSARDRWTGAHMAEYASQVQLLNPGFHEPNVRKIQSDINHTEP